MPEHHEPAAAAASPVVPASAVDPARTVAVVIPARGEEPFLAEAIASVLAQPEVVQVVVATHDAGSATARLVAAHADVRVQLAPSHGPSAGENLDAGIAATAGIAAAPLLAFLDADDRWPPGRIAAGLAGLAAAPQAQLCIGRQRAITADGDLLGGPAAAPLLGAVLVHRAAVERIGAFGSDLVAQMRWLVRARECGVATVQIDDVVLHRRGHSGNLTTVQRPELHRAYLALARERVQRRDDPDPVA